jgi:hypothetical protein
LKFPISANPPVNLLTGEPDELTCIHIELFCRLLDCFFLTIRQAKVYLFVSFFTHYYLLRLLNFFINEVSVFVLTFYYIILKFFIKIKKSPFTANKNTTESVKNQWRSCFIQFHGFVPLGFLMIAHCFAMLFCAIFY